MRLHTHSAGAAAGCARRPCAGRDGRRRAPRTAGYWSTSTRCVDVAAPLATRAK